MPIGLPPKQNPNAFSNVFSRVSTQYSVLSTERPASTAIINHYTPPFFLKKKERKKKREIKEKPPLYQEPKNIPTTSNTFSNALANSLLLPCSTSALVTRPRLAKRMISTTRRWLRRNRTAFAIGFGAVGIGYIAGQYVLSKITEVRERMASDRIAKEKYTFFALAPKLGAD